jgi:hypothetical protein
MHYIYTKYDKIISGCMQYHACSMINFEKIFNPLEYTFHGKFRKLFSWQKIVYAEIIVT